MRFFENKIFTLSQRQRLLLYDLVTAAELFLEPKTPLEIAKDGYMQKKLSATAETAQFIKDSIELLILSLLSSSVVKVADRVSLYEHHLERKHLTADIIRYLDSHMGQSVSINGISKEFSYSSSTIKNVFKQETGYSVIEYYNRMRFDLSKKLLADPTYPISRIAETLGFIDSSHFSNFFKKSAGMTPRTYRENTNQNPKEC